MGKENDQKSFLHMEYRVSSYKCMIFVRLRAVNNGTKLEDLKLQSVLTVSTTSLTCNFNCFFQKNYYESNRF